MQIRVAVLSDAQQLAELHIASWRLAYREALSAEYLLHQVEVERHAHWQEILSKPAANQHVLIALDGQHVLGFICFYGKESVEWGSYIHNLHVAEIAHGKGIAAQLMLTAAQNCERVYGDGAMYLWVLQSNLRAQRFYQKCGGVQAGSDIWQAPGGTEAATDRYHWPSTANLVRHLSVQRSSANFPAKV